MSVEQCYAAIYDYNGGYHFVELPILARTWKGIIVKDEDGDDVSLGDLNATLDHAAALLRSNETVADIKAELEERLRMNLAHLDIVHPNIKLREL